MMSHIVNHVALEPIDGRYSAQWLDCIKPEFEKYADQRKWKMVDLLGTPIDKGVTAGGFLNFADTNIWKASQIVKISEQFSKGFVKPGDVFLFTDAWNPGILQVKYMADLLDIPVKIVGYWHAGSYDTNDVLGYKIKNRTWSLATEKALFHTIDKNIFATRFHASFFIKHCLRLNHADHNITDKIVVSGQPHYEIIKWFDSHQADLPPKEDIVLFPHRLCQEKRPEIFEQLKELMPEYQFIRTQDMNLNKDEYYRLMQRSKVVFSAAEHEMLGISMMEAVLAGAIPVMPNRLAYHEIYDEDFLYPSEYTKPGHVDYHRLMGWIDAGMEYCESPILQVKMKQQREVLVDKYLTCEPMWEAIIG